MIVNFHQVLSHALDFAHSLLEDSPYTTAIHDALLILQSPLLKVGNKKIDKLRDLDEDDETFDEPASTAGCSSYNKKNAVANAKARFL